MISQIKSLVWALLVPLLALAAFAQEQGRAPSRPRPAPHVTGRFLDTDGARRLTLEYLHNSKSETFTGTIHSACVLPAQSKSGEGKPLELSAIPTGTLMTAFYVRHAAENVVLAIRIDRLRGRSSALPQGVYIPCFKGQPAH